MTGTIKINCPSCGASDGLFKTTVKPQSNADMVGAICNTCGYMLAKGDIEKALGEIARKQIQESFAKMGFKKR